jgi:hypothetical protein
MADQAGLMAVNRAVEALTDDPPPPGAFIRPDQVRSPHCPGSVAARPFTVGNFSGQQLVTGLCTLAA